VVDGVSVGMSVMAAALPAIGAKPRRGGIPHVQREDSRILARPQAARRQHRQKARPDARQECSGNQAVNKRFEAQLGVGPVVTRMTAALVSEHGLPEGR
jgi:hypothetical protein